MKMLNIKLCFKTVASVCLTFPCLMVHADAICSFYAKFKNTDRGYLVESASKSYIDEENVLLVKYNIDTNVVMSMELPLTNDKSCSLAYNNSGHNAVCSGDFINSNGTVAKNVFFTTITLGLGPLATGGLSGGQTNFKNIKLATENSDVTTSLYTTPILQECKVELTQKSIQQKTQEKLKIEQNIERQAEFIQQKEQDQNWLKSMQQFRKALKQGMNTNCGTVIELKNSIVHVQTGGDARDAWIPISNIYSSTDNRGRYVGCRDDNIWYKRYGNWVTNNNFYKNGTAYNDDI